MDKIARLRQEIERRINILTNVYAEQLERKDEEMMNYYHGKVIALEELRPFLDTISEEPDTPEFPETFEICLYDGRTPDNEKCTECSTTCSVRKEESDKSLEEAAEEWAENEAYGKSDAEFEMAYKGFIAGWKCKDDQMPMPEDTVLFQKGVAEGRRLEREDMLKDAVEADVNTYKDPVLSCGWAEFVVDMPSSETDKFGNKVRIVVLKEEDE